MTISYRIPTPLFGWKRLRTRRDTSAHMNYGGASLERKSFFKAMKIGTTRRKALLNKVFVPHTINNDTNLFLTGDHMFVEDIISI